jgi:oligopeptide transport system substrate-binding protein
VRDAKSTEDGLLIPGDLDTRRRQGGASWFGGPASAKGQAFQARAIRALGGTGITRGQFLKVGGAGMGAWVLLGTAGCGIFGQEDGGGGNGGKSLSINLGNPIKDLNSTTTTDTVSFDVLLNTTSGLYRPDADNKPVPDMAEGVDVSPDKLTYTFTLREGIGWSNGDPVTALDFEYAWMRALDPETAGQYAYIIASFIKGAAPFNAGDGDAEDVAIEAPDEKTLRVTLERPAPFWLGLTSFATYLSQKQDFVEEQGEDYAQSADALLYNGPYTLTDFAPTEGITLVKNENYWDAGSVDVRRVEGKIVKELSTAVNLYGTGELDDTKIQGQYATEYEDSQDFWSQTFFASVYLVFNFREPLFQNENIRRAYQMGFDREAMTREILNDGSDPADGYVPAGVAGPSGQTFREAQGAVAPAYDAEEARSFFERGIEEVGDNPIIELLAYDDSTSRDIATYLQSQFEDNLGANVNVKAQPADRKIELEDGGEFQLSVQGWFADYNDPMTFLDIWLGNSPFNTQNYRSERFDRLVNGALEETDFARRMVMLQEAERLLVEEEAGTAPMYYGGEARIVKPYIKDYVNHPYGASRDIRWWRIEG